MCTHRVSPHDYYLGFTGVTHDEVCNVLYMRSCSEEWEVENFADASMRKQAKYHDLREAVKAAGHKCHLWTVQVGSRGIIDELSFQPLHALCSSPKQDIANLYFKLARTSLLESFTIWCSRNNPSN